MYTNPHKHFECIRRKLFQTCLIVKASLSMDDAMTHDDELTKNTIIAESNLTIKASKQLTF